MLIHVVGNGLFRRLAATISADEWLDDPAFDSDARRGDRRDELCERVQAWCADKTTETVLAAMAGAGVPAGPVLSLAQALRHEQVDALGLLSFVDFPGRPGKVPVADLPVSLSRTPAGIDRRPPGVSEHTDEVLAELGYSDSEISQLRSEQVV